MGSLLDTDLGTVAELAERLGSVSAASALLRDLGVPVRHGVFSRRLLLERLERPLADETSDRPEAIAILSGLLRPLGVRVIDYHVGRPTTVKLLADGTARSFGFPRSSEPLLAPITISATEPTTARVYKAKTRAQWKAAFTFSGFFEESPIPLYLAVLLDERRAWGLTAGELRMIYAELKKGDAGALTKQFVRIKGRPVMRATFPLAPGDWDLDMRLTEVVGTPA